jgi:hypothetical protein
MARSEWSGRRKRRTRQHVIAEMSINYLERQVLRRGHQLRRVAQPEYGTDAEMFHFSPDTGEVEQGRIEFQLKATDHIKLVDRGKSASCRVDMADLHYWYHEVDHPFILVLYDAARHCAYWLDIQSYVEEQRELDEDPASDTVTLRIPIQNRLSVRAIDRFRRMSLARIRSLD